MTGLHGHRTEQAPRHRGCADVKEGWSFRALNVCCRRVAVEAWMYGALEARCRRVDVEVLRHGALQLWEARCRCGDVEVWRHRALVCCRRADVEA